MLGSDCTSCAMCKNYLELSSLAGGTGGAYIFPALLGIESGVGTRRGGSQRARLSIGHGAHPWWRDGGEGWEDEQGVIRERGIGRREGERRVGGEREEERGEGLRGEPDEGAREKLGAEAWEP